MDTKFKQIVASEAARLGSLNKLCKLANVPQSSVSDWMRGKSGISWAVASKLMEALKIDLVLSNSR
jgi:hypothetical protein